MFIMQPYTVSMQLCNYVTT